MVPQRELVYVWCEQGNVLRVMFEASNANRPAVRRSEVRTYLRHGRGISTYQYWEYEGRRLGPESNAVGVAAELRSAGSRRSVRRDTCGARFPARRVSRSTTAVCIPPSTSSSSPSNYSVALWRQKTPSGCGHAARILPADGLVAGDGRECVLASAHCGARPHLRGRYSFTSLRRYQL